MLEDRLAAFSYLLILSVPKTLGYPVSSLLLPWDRRSLPRPSVILPFLPRDRVLILPTFGADDPSLNLGPVLVLPWRSKEKYKGGLDSTAAL